MFPPPPARSQYSVLIRGRGRGRGRGRTRLRVGMSVRVRVGFKDRVGVQNGQNFPSCAFGAHGASGAYGLLRAAPLATDCWPEAPLGRGGGGEG